MLDLAGPQALKGVYRPLIPGEEVAAVPRVLLDADAPFGDRAVDPGRIDPEQSGHLAHRVGRAHLPLAHLGQPDPDAVPAAQLQHHPAREGRAPAGGVALVIQAARDGPVPESLPRQFADARDDRPLRLRVAPR